MYTNEYIALQLHKLREIESRINLHPNRAVAEAIREEKREILRTRKIRRG